MLGDLPHADIVYDYNTLRWACCGSDTTGIASHCANSTSETFLAPAPEALLPFSASSVNGVPSSTPSSTSSSVPPHSGLSTGAVAGVAVGVSLAGSLLIAAAVFVLLGRRKRRLVQQGGKQFDYAGATTKPEKGWWGRWGGKSGFRAELQAGDVAHEMDADVKKELDGSSSWNRETQSYGAKSL